MFEVRVKFDSTNTLSIFRFPNKLFEFRVRVRSFNFGIGSGGALKRAPQKNQLNFFNLFAHKPEWFGLKILVSVVRFRPWAPFPLFFKLLPYVGARTVGIRVYGEQIAIEFVYPS